MSPNTPVGDILTLNLLADLDGHMNKAEEIFRTYFATAEDMHAFREKYIVVSHTDGDNWGIGSCELHVTDQNGERMVYEDKPSKIYVMPAGTWYATVIWEYANGVCHREHGPAAVCVDSKSGVLECYYENGTELRSQMTKGRANRAKKYFFRGVQLT